MQRFLAVLILAWLPLILSVRAEDIKLAHASPATNATVTNTTVRVPIISIPLVCRSVQL